MQGCIMQVLSAHNLTALPNFTSHTTSDSDSTASNHPQQSEAHPWCGELTIAISTTIVFVVARTESLRP